MNGLQHFIDNAWRRMVGTGEVPLRAPDLEAIKKIQTCRAFLEGMVARVTMGYFRYGPNRMEKDGASLLAKAEEKIRKYRKTGNRESLIDASNYLMLVFSVTGERDFESDDDEDHWNPIA